MDGALEFISTSEGKLVPDGSDNFEYVYNIKDHLGNVRVSFKDDGNGNANLVQQDHYYPFGMRLAYLSEDNGNTNKYLYNEKELNDDHNLFWYHYGARYYDPQLGRWWAVDPADEQISTFTYCANNPIIFSDTDGRLIGYSHFEIRAAVPVYKGIGITASINVGIMWCKEENQFAHYYQGSFGLSFGGGLAASEALGVLSNTSIKSVEGRGLSIGKFAPGLGSEINSTIAQNMSSTGTGINGSGGFAEGAAFYGEGTHTWIRKTGTVHDCAKSIINDIKKTGLCPEDLGITEEKLIEKMYELKSKTEDKLENINTESEIKMEIAIPDHTSTTTTDPE